MTQREARGRRVSAPQHMHGPCTRYSAARARRARRTSRRAPQAAALTGAAAAPPRLRRPAPAWRPMHSRPSGTRASLPTSGSWRPCLRTRPRQRTRPRPGAPSALHALSARATRQRGTCWVARSRPQQASWPTPRAGSPCQFNKRQLERAAAVRRACNRDRVPLWDKCRVQDNLRRTCGGGHVRLRRVCNMALSQERELFLP